MTYTFMMIYLVVYIIETCVWCLSQLYGSTAVVMAIDDD